MCNHGTTVTNAERIRAMSDEELANLLSQTAYGNQRPWEKPFGEQMCKKCPAVLTVYKGYPLEHKIHECDFVDGKCPHGSDVLWWLRQNAPGN